MKKRLTWLAALVCIFSLAACSNDGHHEDLLGAWYNLDNEEFVLNFLEDGTVTGLTDDGEAMYWRTSSDILTFTDMETEEDHSAWAFEIKEDDVLVLEGVNRDGERFTNPSGEASIRFEFRKQ